MTLKAHELKTPVPVIEVQVRWDVTPEDYALAFGLSLYTARVCFRVLAKKDNPVVIRCGVPTPNYPEGKTLRMSRAYFEAQIGKTSLPVSS